MEALVDDAERAIVANDGAALRDAIRRGANVNGMVPWNPYAWGARGHYPLLSSAAFEGRAGICEILLAEGADVNIGVALHSAAFGGFTACLRLLLRAGADVNARANDGGTPLHIACHYGRVHAVELLILAGANTEARTRLGTTPLRVALKFGQREVALTLLRAGAAITVLPTKCIEPKNRALQDHFVDILHDGGWNARVERHRRPLMSILSNLALPHDALCVILSFWSPPGGR
jgi:hypothetical protein